MDLEFPHLPRRTLRLDNGVRVALLHDAEAPRAAVAASVAAGSCHEPPEWPGLAHFLEHGLFLGSAGHPGIAAFADYVHGCGGRYNARTLNLQTLYYLEVPARELAPALGRLVDLLARPLLDDARLAAEREVLDAEYRARCADADCQLQGALAGLLHPDHPLARFHAGNRDTLDTDDPRLLATLRAWHARHYRGAGLRLLLSGPQPLDELERLARELGAGLPAGEPPAPPCWPAPWPVGQGPRQLLLEQPQALRRMSLWLPLRLLPAQEDELLALLREAASQPAAGGLLAELRARGWAQQLALDWLAGADGAGLLGLRLDLLAAGEGQEAAVAALCVDWLRCLRRDPALAPGAAEWRALARERAWQESELAPMERAGLWLERWARQDADWQPWAAATEPVALLAGLALAEPLAPIVQGARARLDAGEPTPWFPLRCQVAPLAGLPALVSPHWQPAAANPFLGAPVGGVAEAHPALRPGHAALLLLWRAEHASAAARLAAELGETALAGHWQQALHGAARLGHDWQTLARPGQLRGCLSGPAGSLPAVLERLLEALAQGEPAQWRADLQRRRAAEAQQLLLRRLLAHPAAQWRLAGVATEELSLDALDDAALRRLLHDFLATATRLARPFGAPAACLPPGFALAAGAPSCAVPTWPSGEQVVSLDLGGGEHAALLRVLAAPGAARQEAAWRLLAVLQQNAFYQALRVEQGLGYALFSRFLAGEEGAELQFGVQSPHADSQQLRRAIHAFLDHFAASLADLDAARLQQARQAALDGLAAPAGRRARLVRACSDWLGGRDAEHERAVRAELQRLTRTGLQDAAGALGGAAWRWLLSD
ncbi:pyrroloquinoline quinone biosynthesis protein PqqF [Pseudomonas oryzae]|uniref:Pyrroloquinoline quinone synthesis related protease (PqqF). Metallo peptidase. MEROPS family M16A n=1 Tax=Pseudomonas oryzae TaxID=1392877 RepID=A0A1H1VNU4_9PSED|nr:pyrroloquinoline quinone biosynthesis protein PqqF [Pseudomonas oryzae]SDS86071.1 pyrroloquinoline quinone synthesis related protease (pqqF). Metallo peptidase. MEROPS family M16A [Pseudomonas oryzae]